MTGWDMIVWGPVSNMMSKLAVFVPVLIGALLIFLLGWIVARFLGGMMEKFLLTKFGGQSFNDVLTNVGLAEILRKGNIPFTPAALIAGCVYWMVMIVVLAVTVDVLGLNVAAGLLVKVTGYLPNVVSAIFVLIIGMFLGSLVAGAVRAAVANASLPRAELLGSIARGAILLFTAIVVLDVLNIASFFVTTTFQIILGAVSLALALAFGLGGKDLAAKILWDFYNKQNMSK